MFQQREQRALAGVERDEVEEVEDTRLGQLAQLGVDEAAAQRGDDRRVVRLDRLRDAERARRPSRGRAPRPARASAGGGRWRPASTPAGCRPPGCVARPARRPADRRWPGSAPAIRRSARIRSAGPPRRAARRPGRSGRAWRSGARGPAGRARRRPRPAGRRRRRRRKRPASRSAGLRAGSCGCRCDAPAWHHAPAGRRSSARWWRRSARIAP